MDHKARWPRRWVGWWVAADGKAVLIETRLRSILVSVAPDREPEPYVSAQLLDGEAKRIERLEPSPWVDERGRRYLEIEAGTPEVGPTYRLYSAVELSPGSRASAENKTDVRDVILIPDSSMGLYDDWEDDLGVPWAYPLDQLRWAASA
jgi:hypothetical protein